MPGAAASCASSHAAISSSVCLGLLLAPAALAVLTGSAVAAATGCTGCCEASALLTTSQSAKQQHSYTLRWDSRGARGSQCATCTWHECACCCVECCKCIAWQCCTSSGNYNTLDCWSGAVHAIQTQIPVHACLPRHAGCGIQLLFERAQWLQHCQSKLHWPFCI